jgi:spore coat protein A
MGSTNRRDFLKLAAASLPALALVPGDTQPVYRTPDALERYIDPLPIPKRLAAQGTRNGRLQYHVRMLEFTRQLHSQLPPTKLWGFEGQYPGPTFEAFRGKAIEVRWENGLPAKHIFDIDPHIHGAMPPSPAVRTVTHLHGSRTHSESDGLPEKWFTPGESALYLYPNEQKAATLWYHDHALGITRLNVYAGLSGFYLLRDEQERSMNLPSGEYEVPLILQDRTLDQQGQLVYSPKNEDGTHPPPGVWAPEFFGELPLVNGAVYAHLDVEPRAYRLRVLNGANSRFFNLYFNLAKSATDIPSLVSFQQIGTDGGFLPKPVALKKLLMGPAERADLIVDFSGLEGKTITLSNDAAAPFPGWGILNATENRLDELMQFRVTRPLSGGAKAFSMPSFAPVRRLIAADAVRTRDFVLIERMDSSGKSLGVRINDKGYDAPVTETVKLGSVEKWRFINSTDDAHPMHLHLVQFEILERQGYDAGALLKGMVRALGAPRAPAANEMGPKDTATVNPGEMLTLLVKFDGYAGRYVYHCHMLEHEDNDMMRPYEVV